MTTAIGFVLAAASIVVAGGPSNVTGTGTNIDRVKTVSNTGSQSTSSGLNQAGPSGINGEYVDIVGANRRLLLTDTSLVVARFTAEASCDQVFTKEAGPSAPSAPNGPSPLTACLTRIIVENTGNGFVDEMEPAPGEGYSFVNLRDGELICCDLPPLPESHNMERHITLPPGDYTFQVQFVAFPSGPAPDGPPNGGGTSIVFTVDDWELTVERVT